MAPAPGSRALTITDLAALAANEYPVNIIYRLREAESSKHAFLIEALRRAVNGGARGTDAAVIGDAVAVLADVQAAAPGVVADVLALPQVGYWAADCLSQLRGGAADRGSPSRLDLAHMAGFAAVAALRARHPFDLAVPVRGGAVVLPTLGMARIGNDGWARVRGDGDRATVTAGSATVDIPAGPAYEPLPHWVPAPRLRVHARGLRLDVVLDAFDPFLTRMAPAADGGRLDPRAWQRLLQRAWEILVRHDRPAARGLAAALTTLVPLRERAPDQPSSASSGWAWGAIALSLPADALSLAEMLVHEFQHIVLSAVEDLAPLTGPDDGQLYYSPWRDDPRPLRGLLQGAYAYLGVSDFWYRLRHAGPPAQRSRSQVEFTRRRQNTLDATRTLAGSAVLTAPGGAFVAGMDARLSRWPRDGVSAGAATMAAELILEHRLRWRLSHLHPDAAAVDTLAKAWIAGVPRRPAGPDPRTVLAPAARPLPDELSCLLELRCRDRRRLRDRLYAAAADVAPPAGEDVALLEGDDTQALNGYLARVTAADSRAADSRAADSRLAWVGLILAWRRLADRAADWPILREPELFAAVFARVRALAGQVNDGLALIAWLNGDPGKDP